MKSAKTLLVRSLQELLSPFVSQPLDQEKLAQLQLYLDLLLKWNSKINLTGIRGPEQIVARHFGESLFTAERLELSDASTLVDFGSGAGFPGLPIKIAAPHLEVTLVESQQKKVAFLREVVRALKLENISVYAGRAEESQLKSQIVTMRAVEKFEAALPVAASLVEPGGRLALLIGTKQSDIVRSLLSRFQWQKLIAIPHSRERAVMIGHIVSYKDQIDEAQHEVPPLDPVLAMSGVGKDLWKEIDPDSYVSELRDGWETED